MHWSVSRLNRIALARNEPGTRGRFTFALVPLLLIGLLQTVSAEAQTVRIDATPSRVANTFSPLQALGSTVDRIPSNTTDTFFRPDQIQTDSRSRLGSGQLSTEYGAICSGLALESEGNLERPLR